MLEDNSRIILISIKQINPTLKYWGYKPSNQTGISVSRFLPNSILWEKVIQCRTITVKIKYAQTEKCYSNVVWCIRRENSTSKPAVSYCLRFSGSDKILYEYATSLNSSDASGLLAFLSGWYLSNIIVTMKIIQASMAIKS